MKQKEPDTVLNPLQQPDPAHSKENTPSGFTAFKSMKDLLNANEQSNQKPLDDKETNNAEYNNFAYTKKQTDLNHQTIIVKKFTKDSYNGPTLNDFMERLNIIFEAAEKMIQDNHQDQIIKEKKMAILRAHKEIAIKTLEKNCTIEPIPFKELFYNLKAHEELVLAKITSATHIIGEFINNSLPLFNESHTKAKKNLAKTESEITVQKGRPNFINYYPSTTAECERVSIQRVIGDAIPSTERSKAQLPNFVECGIGYKKDNTYQEQFHGYRHSSYTPIKMENKDERARATRETVKEMLTELTRQEIKKSSYKENNDPIAINFSSLSLLSPIFLDHVAMHGESEVNQLTECYDALMSFNKIPLKLDIEGKTYTIKPNITVLNAASNGHGANIHNNFNNGLMYRELRINAQGINQFAFKTLNYLLDNTNQNTNPLLKSAVDLLTELQQQKDTVEQKKKGQSPDEIKKTQENILDLEVEYYNKFEQLFNKNRNEFLKELINAAKSKNPNDDNKENNDIDVANLAFQAIAMQIDHTLEPPQYGARYLLACQKMGDFVDFYCKSGEDRTGRMQNFLEELCEYKREYNEYPEYKYDKGYLYGYRNEIIAKNADTQVRIAQHASEFAASRDINDQNAHGARGLQIGSDLKLNSNLPNATGKALAKMAKGVYDVSSSLTSDNYIAQILNEISEYYQQIKKERKKLVVGEKMDVAALSALQQKIESNITLLRTNLDKLNSSPFKELLISNKEWSPNLSRMTEKVTLHMVDINNEIKQYERLLNKVTVEAGTSYYLYVGNGISVLPITVQDKKNVINTPNFSANTILTAKKNNSDNTSLLKVDNEPNDDMHYRCTTNYAGNDYNTIAIFDLSIEQAPNNSPHSKPNIKLQMIQAPTCITADENSSIQIITPKLSLKNELHSYMSMALTILTAKDGIPTPDHPIIIEHGTAQQREMLWSVLVILGEKKFDFKPDALQVSAGEFSPDKIITKGFLGKTNIAKESILHELTSNKDMKFEVDRYLKDAGKIKQDMEKGNASDFKSEIEKGRERDATPDSPRSVTSLN